MDRLEIHNPKNIQIDGKIRKTVTTDKITKRFDSISRVEIKNNNEIE